MITEILEVGVLLEVVSPYKSLYEIEDELVALKDKYVHI